MTTHFKKGKAVEDIVSEIKQEEMEHNLTDCSDNDYTPDSATKLHECKYCEKKFRYSHGLKTHVKKYHQVKSNEETTEETIHYIQIIKGSDIVFVCQYCDRRFKHEGFIQRHIRSIHPGKMIGQESRKNICDLCGRTFAKVTKLRQHKSLVHYNTKEYTCNVCNKLFKMKFNLLKHIKQFHPDFDNIDHAWSEKELYNHTEDTEESKTQIKVFRSNEVEPEINIINLKYNRNRYKKNPVQCEICNNILSEKSGLKRHLEEVHSVAVTKRPKPLKCWVSDCNESFHSLHRLRQHLMNTEEDGGHNWIIEEEENIFENFEEFSQWKADVEENENLRYISLSSVPKNEDGSFRRVYHCSRSGRYSSSGTGKRRVKIQTQGTSKIGRFCPSSMNVYGDSLGKVTCNYYKTHHGHDTSANDIMHIRLHKRDKEFIIEKACQGVEHKKILAALHAKGGRSAFIKLKDIKNHIMLHGIPEPYHLSQENYEISVPNFESIEKIEVIEHEYSYESEYNYEIYEAESLITENDYRDETVSETDTILSQLSNTLATNSGTITENNYRDETVSETDTILSQLSSTLATNSGTITENDYRDETVSETDTILSQLSSTLAKNSGTSIREKDYRDETVSETDTIFSHLSSTLATNTGTSIECIKPVTHQLKVIDDTVHIYQVDNVD